METTPLYPPHITSLIEVALAGDADAQNDLGDIYREGDGIRHDLKEAVRWYRMAADKGDPYGQNNLGSMYFNGLGVPYNAEEAVRWYQLAVAQGLGIAQFNLAVCYRDGEGVERDLTEAAQYFKLAADAGHPEAKNEYALYGGNAAAGNQSQKPELFLIRGDLEDEPELAAMISLYEALTGKKATPEEIQEVRDDLIGKKK